MTLSASAPPTTRASRISPSDVRGLVSGTRRILARGDLAAAAATMTYYAAIAVVPWVLLAIWSTTWVRGASDAASTWLGLDVLIPPAMGGREVFDEAVAVGTGLSALSALVLLFPASFYGEGLRRACLTLYPEKDRFTGWRSRLSILALFVLVPPLTHVAVAVGGSITGLAPDGGGTGGFWDLAARVVIGFVTVWLTVAAALTWVYWKVTPGGPSLAVAAVTALGTASFIAGFVQGFLLFLSLPIDVGIPYGGLRVIGGVVAAGLWLFVLHILVIVGWAVGQALGEVRKAGVRRAGARAGDDAG
ncbi:YhjD/YihY/BrkB family envelope integrity protein [Gordonia westfalica]|uniref:YhjD/YihY/BrkB family envelope integrity protein n=1 Tax=Gordonia westfalica TaxID=158898 RepID=UPI000945C68F|nr:YhjD/YihY/BrkB family envelope integrity protein [Gordonia westfalica]